MAQRPKEAQHDGNRQEAVLHSVRVHGNNHCLLGLRANVQETCAPKSEVLAQAKVRTSRTPSEPECNEEEPDVDASVEPLRV
jgi:hypothetical protein